MPVRMCPLLFRARRCVKVVAVTLSPDEIATHFQQFQIFIEAGAFDARILVCGFRGKGHFIMIGVRRQIQIKLQSVGR